MVLLCLFFFQAEDGIRDLVRSRGLGDVYKRQGEERSSRTQGGVTRAPHQRNLVRPSTRLCAAFLFLSLIHI